MEVLGRKYRTYALDFWGFGESGKKRQSYTVQDFVVLVDQFMDRLGISRAPLVGHSMGGTVSLSVAVEFPQRVSKVVAVGSPITGSSLAWALKMAGHRPIAFLLFNMMGLFRLGVRVAAPFISRDPGFPAMMDRDLSRTTVESFLLSISSLRRTDLRPLLPRIKLPVMGMYGERDNIVHPFQWQSLLEGIPHACIERFPQAGHFPMLDEPETFMGKLMDFIDKETTS